MPIRIGSSGPLVTEWQRVMLWRFAGYAKAADGGPLRTDGYFGYDDQAVANEWQRRAGRPVRTDRRHDILTDDDLTALGVIQPRPARPTLFTVHGTGVSMWDGPPADLARAVSSRWTWQPIGNYPATPFPMWPSIQLGCAELRLQIARYAGPIALAGFSQGAIVVGQVWKHDILNPAGVLHHRLRDVVKAVTWGDPMREQGRAHHDGVGRPVADSSAGILEDRLVNTPDWWRSYAHRGDIYTDNPQNDSGEYSTAICKIVMGNDWWAGRNSILAQVMELLAAPLTEAIYAVDAIVKAGMFFFTGTRDHLNYNIRPAVDYLLS